MKILLFTSKFPPEIGGVENVTYNLAKKFIDKDNDVLVLKPYSLRKTRDNPNSGQSLLNKMVKGFVVSGLKSDYRGVSIKEVFMSLPRSLMGFLSFPYRFIASVIKTRAVISEYDPEVINFHFPDDSLYYFYFSTLGLNIPIVVNIHGNELHLFSKNPVYRFFLSRVLKKSRSVVVNSDYMKKELTKIYSGRGQACLSPTKVVIISNGIDLYEFKDTSTNNFKYKPNSYYLYVGRLDHKKGVDILIKAFNKSEGEIKRKLVIVGGSSGGEKSHGARSMEDYKKMAENSNIIFEGWVDSKDVKKYYKNAYFSIFPSRHEPFGIVALESFACGTPIIASSGGFKEIINKTEAGISFKPESVEELKDILLKVDEDEGLRKGLSEKAVSTVKNYSWESISKKYLKLFSEFEKKEEAAS